MEWKEEELNKLSLADLIALEMYCDSKINFHEQYRQSNSNKLINEYWGPISCIAMTNIGFRINEIFTKPEKVWQYSTKQIPDDWKDATDEEYEAGKDLVRFNWRQIQK